MTPVGIVTGTPLGRALATRLRADGREIFSGGEDALAEVARARLIVIDAEPSQLRSIARALGDLLDGDRLLAHTVRGLTPDGAGPIEAIRQETPVLRIGVLAGPIAIADLDAGRPTAAVIASRHPEVVDELAVALSTPHLRVYRGRDPVGVELASALDDLITVGCGLAEGLALGAPARAVMMVRCVRELGRLIGALGGDPATAVGLAGLGDVLVQGADSESEPFLAGLALAHGKKLSPTGRLAELLSTASRVRALVGRHRVSAHVLDGIARLVAGETAGAELVTRLMTLPVLDE